MKELLPVPLKVITQQKVLERVVCINVHDKYSLNFYHKICTHIIKCRCLSSLLVVCSVFLSPVCWKLVCMRPIQES